MLVGLPFFLCRCICWAWMRTSVGERPKWTPWCHSPAAFPDWRDWKSVEKPTGPDGCVIVAPGVAQLSSFGIGYCSVVHIKVVCCAMYDLTAYFCPASEQSASYLVACCHFPDPSAKKEANELNQNIPTYIWKHVYHMSHPTHQSLISTWSKSALQFGCVMYCDNQPVRKPTTLPLMFQQQASHLLLPTMCSLCC